MTKKSNTKSIEELQWNSFNQLGQIKRHTDLPKVHESLFSDSRKERLEVTLKAEKLAQAKANLKAMLIRRAKKKAKLLAQKQDFEKLITKSKAMAQELMLSSHKTLVPTHIPQTYKIVEVYNFS